MFHINLHAFAGPVISLLAALRKHRLRDFNDMREVSSIAELNLKTKCNFEFCALCAATSSRLVEKYARDRDSRWQRKFRSTASIIDLGLYESSEQYRRQVSASTSGKYLRSEKKARRRGYLSRRVGLGSHQRSIYAIRASKPRRSKGKVWEAFVPPRDGMTDIDVKFEMPSCREHWMIQWGGFKKTLSGEQLVAYATLLRSGNQVCVLHLMGHGSALADGVTKVLMFDIMAWLLAREEPCVEGLRYFIHGTVEEGSKGLTDWKRYFRFLPMLVNCTDLADPARVTNFDGDLYLTLNPDVALAGVDPYQHYMTYGMLEGRKISRD